MMSIRINQNGLKTTILKTGFTNFAVVDPTMNPYFNTTNLNDTSLIGIISYNNHTAEDEGLLIRDHVFDRTDVRVIFTAIYTLVFSFCFFGK